MMQTDSEQEACHQGIPDLGIIFIHAQGLKVQPIFERLTRQLSHSVHFFLI